MDKRKESSGYCKAVTAFIACSKTKKSYSCKARDLYQGALFKKALVFAERNYKHVFILSANYGVVELDRVIAPYEKTLKNMTKGERQAWYNLVKIQMRKLTTPFVFFTGELYHFPFNGYKPLTGLSLGRQLKWFNNKSRPKGIL